MASESTMLGVQMETQSRQRQRKEVEKTGNMWTMWEWPSGARDVVWNLYKMDFCVQGISSVGAGEEAPVSRMVWENRGHT